MYLQRYHDVTISAPRAGRPARCATCSLPAPRMFPAGALTMSGRPGRVGHRSSPVRARRFALTGMLVVAIDLYTSKLLLHGASTSRDVRQ